MSTTEFLCQLRMTVTVAVGSVAFYGLGRYIIKKIFHPTNNHESDDDEEARSDNDDLS